MEIQETQTITETNAPPTESSDDGYCSTVEKPMNGTIGKKQTFSQRWGFRNEIVWFNVFWFLVMHISLAYWLVMFPYLSHKMTTVWLIISIYIGNFGVTAGAHRLWTHRAYKATLPLRIILLFCYNSSGLLKYTLYNWVRDHRVHHKYSDTDADPHNIKRGFFFAHVGWILSEPLPEVERRLKQIDMNDMDNDPVVMYGEKYFWPLSIFWTFLLPILVPVYLWDEEWKYAIVAKVCIGYPLVINFMSSVNSLAHMFGSKPYDKSICSAENAFVAVCALGEGWHNYHHVFPWDYKTAEIAYYRMNVTTLIIDMFAKIGWAYDLKEPSKELVQKVMENRGDGSKPFWYDEVPSDIDKPKSQ